MRQSIVDAAKVRLETITIANGYATDIGCNAFWWRRRALHEDQLPAVVGFDKGCPSSSTDAPIGFLLHSLTMEFEVLAMEYESDTIIRAAMGDIVKAFTTDRSWLNGMTDNMPELLSSDMDVDEAENKAAAAKVTIQVDYLAPRGQI